MRAQFHFLTVVISCRIGTWLFSFSWDETDVVFACALGAVSAIAAEIRAVHKDRDIMEGVRGW